MMTRDRIAEYRLGVELTKNPRRRRGLIDSVHAFLVQGGARYLTPAELERVAEIEKEYGFAPHAKKLLAHPAYEENRLILKRFEEVEQEPGSLKALCRCIPGNELDQAIQRGLIQEERVAAARRRKEDAHLVNDLETIERHLGETAIYTPHKHDRRLELGVERGLYSQERLDTTREAFRIAACIKTIERLEANPGNMLCYAMSNDKIWLMQGVERGLYTLVRAMAALAPFDKALSPHKPTS
jgi:hypothetical protein